jgi:hypothetical protein
MADPDKDAIRREAIRRMLESGVVSAPGSDVEAEVRVARTRLFDIALSLRSGQPLSPEQETFLLESAIVWLQTNWGVDRRCPYCDRIQWEVGTPVALRTVGGEPITPSFPVMCGNCGQTTFINAVRAGLLPEDD